MPTLSGVYGGGLLLYKYIFFYKRRLRSWWGLGCDSACTVELGRSPSTLPSSDSVMSLISDQIFLHGGVGHFKRVWSSSNHTVLLYHEEHFKPYVVAISYLLVFTLGGNIEPGRSWPRALYYHVEPIYRPQGSTFLRSKITECIPEIGFRETPAINY